MARKNKEAINWKVITIILASVVVVLSVAVLALAFSTTEDKKTTDTAGSSSTKIEETDNETQQEQKTNNEQTTSSVDELMANFSGTDEEVVQVCEIELHNLGIDDYISIDEPLEGPFIQETRVGTYELNGILRTPSNSPDMPQPKSTEMLCTIFPGDEYPVEITFGEDW